jgi:hypothetical protein
MDFKQRNNRFSFLRAQMFRRQLDPEWIGLKPDESLEKCVRKICEAI